MARVDCRIVILLVVCFWVRRRAPDGVHSIRSTFFIQIDASNVSCQLSVGALAGTPPCSQCVWCFALLPSFSFVGALSGHGGFAFDGCEHRRPLRCDPSGSICLWAHGPQWELVGALCHLQYGHSIVMEIVGYLTMGASRRSWPPTVRSQYGHSTVTVRSQYGHSTVMEIVVFLPMCPIKSSILIIYTYPC